MKTGRRLYARLPAAPTVRACPPTLGGNVLGHRVVDDDHAALRRFVVFGAVVLPLRPGLGNGDVEARPRLLLLLLALSNLFDDERVEHEPSSGQLLDRCGSGCIVSNLSSVHSRACSPSQTL